VPPELRVLMDAEIQLKGLISNAEQPKLEKQLLALPGVESLNFTESGVSIRYDPEKLTRAKLCDLIAQAGFPISEVGSAPASPPIEPPENPSTM
jgi:hypothetical protein